MAVMDPPPPPRWSMGTADARLKLTVQFSEIPIFSPAPYLGLGHLVRGSFSGEM